MIKAITGSRICNEEERKLSFLPTRYGELAIAFFHKQAEVKFNNSQRITTEPTILTNRQHTEYTVEEVKIKKIKQTIKDEKNNTYNYKLGTSEE